MKIIKVTLKDGKIKEYEKEISILEVAKSISPSLAKKVLYGVIDNKNYSNNFIIEKDTKLEFITVSDDVDKIINIETSKMIKAIIEKSFKDINIKNTSYDEDYFYIDFESKGSFKESDLLKLTNKIKSELKHFKLESDDFLIKNIKFINNFKLMSISGTYLNGDKTDKMINRINGLAAITKETLDTKESEIKKRLENDHRIIGSKMKLFTFSNEVGQGLPIWLPNGVILKNQIKNYLKTLELKYGFLEVNTPILGTANMYRTSGHLSHYSDDMFPIIKKNDDELMLRPMSCPHHIAVFKNDLVSYRELPLRYTENAQLFRYEKSGALTGLERVRMMELTDSHIFTNLEGLKAEFKNCFNSIQEALNTFGIKIYYYSLSCRDKNNKEKFHNDDKMWDLTEKMLKEVLDELNIKYKVVIGEAAFYGPKFDIQIQSVLKHEITVSTIQLDMLGAKKFNATYINKSGNKEHPVIIHRGLVGTFERFISILLEQTKGVLPLWLSPRQAVIIPINEKVMQYCHELKNKLISKNIRVSIDNSSERLSYKIRNSQINKIPYQLVIGDEEVKNNKITIRRYSDDIIETKTIEEFISELTKIINTKK